MQEAKETEGKEPDRGMVTLGVRSALEGNVPATYWVVETEDKQIAGSISIVTEWSNFRGGEYWWIQSLFIVPEHRGTGLVDQLLEYIIDEAERNGALELRLYALKTNKRALEAYKRSRFIEIPYTVMARKLEKS